MSIPAATSFSEARVPTTFGLFRLRVYEDPGDAGVVAIVSGKISRSEAIPVRIHSACFFSENLGFLGCECRQRLEQALEYISEYGGVVVYLRSNRASPVPDHRPLHRASFVTTAMVLRDLGIDTVSLIGPELGQAEGLAEHGISAVECSMAMAAGAFD